MSRGMYEEALRLSRAILPSINRQGFIDDGNLLLSQVATCLLNLDGDHTKEAKTILDYTSAAIARNGLKEVIRRLIYLRVFLG